MKREAIISSSSSTSSKELEVRVPIDPLWVGCLGLLLAIGTLAIFSASGVLSLRSLGDEYYYVKRHLMFLVGGGILFFVGTRVNLDFLRRFTYPALAVSWFLVAITLIPTIGTKSGGAIRWLRVGGFTFQPVELYKLAFIFYLAHSLSKKQDKVRSFSVGFVPHIGMMFVSVLPLIFQPDLGSSVLICLMTATMLFVAGAQIKHLLLLGVVQLPILAVLVITSPYRMRRILAYLDPWADQYNKGYQIIQSMVAFFNGSTTGVGWGNSQGKLFYLPAAHTDFILAVLGEELGFIGIVGIVFLFILFFSRTVLFSARTNDLFRKFLVLGVSFQVMLQMLINSCVVMGLLPTKGLTLPFISYGGSSLVVMMFMCGLVYNIATRSSKL